MNEIFVEIEGGVLLRVCSNIKDVKVTILDWDEYSNEDELGRIAMDDLSIELKEKINSGELKENY